MEVSENLKLVMSRISEAAIKSGRQPHDIHLVAATKTIGEDKILEAIGAGLKICGENRVQELCEKHEQGAYEGAELHFIGRLQRNKVRQIAGKCSLIQSVDSLELLKEINKRAKALGLVQPVLLQVNIANEESKAGFEPSQLDEILGEIGGFSFILVRGIMAIPPISYNKGENRPYFAGMNQLFVDIRSKKYDNVSMDFLSMGMSGDFEDAIAEGSNMVRVGSAIFGVRPLQQ